MYRLGRGVICLLAVAFAGTGVAKAFAPDAGAIGVTRGCLRVAFGAVIATGALRGLVRGRPAEPRPPDGAGDAAAGGP